MKRWRLFENSTSAYGIGLLAYILALIATAPATLADAGLQRVSEGRLRLVEAQGTLWSGTGQLEIRDTGGHTGLAKRLVWRLQPDASLPARITYEVELDPGSRPFTVTAFWSRIEIEHADISLPALALGLGLPKLAPLELTGGMNLKISNLSIGRDAARGSAILQWRAAGSALSPVSPLGDYELRLEGQGSGARATLHTLAGPLQLDGQALWASGSKPVFQVTAHVPSQFRQQLAPFLRLIAVERGEGRFELQLQ